MRDLGTIEALLAELKRNMSVPGFGSRSSPGSSAKKEKENDNGSRIALSGCHALIVELEDEIAAV